MKEKFTSAALLLLLAAASQAQQKPPIGHDAFDSWKSISTQTLSPSGKYIYYSISPQEGDAVTELKDQQNNLLYRRERGAMPRLTQDEKFFLSSVKPYFKETREAKIKKKKPDEMPKDSLAVFNIVTKESINLGPIKGWKTARLGKSFVAYQQELDLPSKQDTTTKTADKPADSTKTAARKAPAKKESVLILYNLATKDTVQLLSLIHI